MSLLIQVGSVGLIAWTKLNFMALQAAALWLPYQLLLYDSIISLLNLQQTRTHDKAQGNFSTTVHLQSLQ